MEEERYQAPWLNKNKYYLLQPYYMQCWICITGLSTTFFICLYILFFLFLPQLPTLRSFILLSEYLGNLPKFKEFCQKTSEDFMLSPGQGGKAVNRGKKAPFGGHRGERA